MIVALPPLFFFLEHKVNLAKTIAPKRDVRHETLIGELITLVLVVMLTREGWQITTCQGKKNAPFFFFFFLVELDPLLVDRLEADWDQRYIGR